MKILVKNSDRLNSSIHENKMVDEYLVYVMNDNIPIAAEVVYGSSDKNKAIDAYLKKYFTENDDLDSILEEISLEEFKEQINNGFFNG